MTHKQDFNLDGFLAPIGVVTTDRVSTYARHCSSFIEEYSTHPDFSEWTYGKTEILLRWVAELASEKVLLDIVEELIGPDILLWNAFLPIKSPHSTGNFGWHQDATYWPLENKDQIASAWIALSSVDQFNGGMQMVRGSHLLGPISHEKTYDKTSMLRRGQRVSMPIDDGRVVDIELDAGQASFHHTLTLHRSGANQSDSWRLGVGFNFVSANVNPLPGHQDSAILLRGSASGSRFSIVEAPQSDLTEDALNNFSRVQKLQSKRYADVQKK